MLKAIDSLANRFDSEEHKSSVPEIKSFKEFLLNHAKVRTPGGEYVPYSFKGREALIEIVDAIDEVLGSHTGKQLPDSVLAICGGAQFGKTILVLLLMAYLTGGKFMNAAYYLPTGDLVDDIVDGKFRPDVIDQIDWFGDLYVTEKKDTKGRKRKSVDRKGMFKVSDDQRSANGYVKGLQRTPTSISADICIVDEMDDVPAKNANYVSGRMTASDLRFQIRIGTQRIFGAGQNKEFKEGSQGVMMVPGTVTGKLVNPEENWPNICRMAINGTPDPSDPWLTLEGDFRQPDTPEEIVSRHAPDAHYYLADPQTGEVLDRNTVVWRHRRPDRIKQRKRSFRVSQFGIPAIALSQIVSAWCDAVADPEQMIAFCTDRKAIPASTKQSVTPEIITRARSLETHDLSLAPKEGTTLFAGLDTGERCWFWAREVESAAVKRVRWAEKISGEKIVGRAVQLCQALDVSCLFIDAHPLYNEARQIVYALNNMDVENPPQIPPNENPEKLYISFAGGLAWNGPAGRWENLKAAVVNFTLKPGQGIKHVLGKTQEGIFYPQIQCNRDESIQRVINELLTMQEQVVEVIDGQVRTEPSMRLPRRISGSNPIVEDIENHLIVGSEKETNKDGSQSFVDSCENHLLLANAYSGLAETVGGHSAHRPAVAVTVPRENISLRGGLPGGRRTFG